LLGKQTDVYKMMKVHMLQWIVKALPRQLLWWKSVRVHTKIQQNSCFRLDF